MTHTRITTEGFMASRNKKCKHYSIVSCVAPCNSHEYFTILTCKHTLIGVQQFNYD